MSAFTRMKEERDELYERVAELESENRLLRTKARQQTVPLAALEMATGYAEKRYSKLESKVAELDLMTAELRESVKDLLDLTEYGDIDGMVWELVNDGDEWVVERLNRAQRLIDAPNGEWLIEKLMGHEAEDEVSDGIQK